MISDDSLRSEWIIVNSDVYHQPVYIMCKRLETHTHTHDEECSQYMILYPYIYS